MDSPWMLLIASTSSAVPGRIEKFIPEIPLQDADLLPVEILDCMPARRCGEFVALCFGLQEVHSPFGKLIRSVGNPDALTVPQSEPRPPRCGGPPGPVHRLCPHHFQVGPRR